MAGRTEPQLSIPPIYAEIGAWLKEQRTSIGWTQAQVASAMGWSRASVANIEAGRQKMLHHDVLSLQAMFSPEALAEARLEHEEAVLAEAEVIRARRVAMEKIHAED